MKRCRWKSFFENPKPVVSHVEPSAIQNRPRRPKWLGLSIIAFVLVVAGAAGSGAAAEENSSDRISHRKPIHIERPPVSREFDWLCASLATSMDRTSPLSTDMRKGSPIGSLSLQPTWCVSRLISSWPEEGTRWSGRPRMRPIRFPSL